MNDMVHSLHFHVAARQNRQHASTTTLSHVTSAKQKDVKTNM